jgi:hypothetical protein
MLRKTPALAELVRGVGRGDRQIRPDDRFLESLRK